MLGQSNRLNPFLTHSFLDSCFHYTWEGSLLQQMFEKQQLSLGSQIRRTLIPAEKITAIRRQHQQLFYTRARDRYYQVAKAYHKVNEILHLLKEQEHNGSQEEENIPKVWSWSVVLGRSSTSWNHGSISLLEILCDMSKAEWRRNPYTRSLISSISRDHRHKNTNVSCEARACSALEAHQIIIN